MLPYPGRYESHRSWMRRCDEYERDRQRYFKSLTGGLSGKPNEQGIRKDLNLKEKLDDGREVEVVRKGYGWRASQAVKIWAEHNGFDFVYGGNGCSGMCERTDGIAYKGPKYQKREEIYNKD